jgi:lauroyl/myristoyl acyltransferase
MANSPVHRHQELVNRIPVNVDTRASLFAGLKALLAKKILLLAPDGKQGSQNVTISVLGKETSMGHGAAFMAYESKCDIFWLAMTSDGNHFIPEMVAGPRRADAESFSDFQMRFVRFYEKMLNDSFSGDPGNLVPAPRWAKVFAVP